jgi:hypothetical protein
MRFLCTHNSQGILTNDAVSVDLSSYSHYECDVYIFIESLSVGKSCLCISGDTVARNVVSMYSSSYPD